jgi:hypothetical protein
MPMNTTVRSPSGLVTALGAMAISALAMSCGNQVDSSDPLNLDVETVIAAQTITSMGTTAYNNECSNSTNKVPLPPLWGTTKLGDGLNNTWKDNQIYTDAYVFGGGGHIYYSINQSAATPGICVINAHFQMSCTADAPGTFDVICQGTNGKACFWEGVLGTDPPSTTMNLFPTLKGGTDLNTNEPTVTSCTNCHAGDNVFIAHQAPGHPLNLGSLWNPSSWMNPLVKGGSVQNPAPPANQFLGFPASTSNCTGCHVQGNGGRFPKLSAYQPPVPAGDASFCKLLDVITNRPGDQSGMPPSGTCPNGNCAAQTDPFVKQMLERCYHGVDAGTTPAISSRGAQQLEVFATSHGQVRVKKYDDTFNQGWFAWADLPALPAGVTAVSSPAATSWDSTRTDVFVRGSDGRLYHQWRNSGDWSGVWEQLDSGISTGPSVTNWGPGRLDIFALQNGIMWHKWYQNGWYGPETLFTNVPLSSPPAAVAWAAGRIDIVARRSAGNVNQFFYSGGWFGPFDIGGSTNNGATLGISTWGVNRLDIFAVSGSQVKRRSFINVWDPGWTNVLGATNTSGQGVGAVSWGTNRIDIVTNDDGTVLQGFSNAPSPPSFTGWSAQ